MNYFRPTARILIEQPTSSWMYKQTRMLEAISRWKVKKYLTYMGSWGAPLMKGTHLMSNFSCSAIVRKATKSLRETVAKRLKTLNEKRLAKACQQQSSGYVTVVVNSTEGKISAQQRSTLSGLLRQSWRSGRDHCKFQFNLDIVGQSSGGQCYQTHQVLSHGALQCYYCCAFQGFEIGENMRKRDKTI